MDSYTHYTNIQKYTHKNCNTYTHSWRKTYNHIKSLEEKNIAVREIKTGGKTSRKGERLPNYTLSAGFPRKKRKRESWRHPFNMASYRSTNYYCSIAILTGVRDVCSRLFSRVNALAMFFFFSSYMCSLQRKSNIWHRRLTINTTMWPGQIRIMSL